MNRITSSFPLLALLGLWLAQALCAQTGGGTGTLAGRVTDAATKLALGGVRVSVVGLPGETYTSKSGDYVLNGVPVGPQAVEFGYVGYAELQKRVNVGASVTRLDAAFGEDVVRLDAFVITGSLVGQARAINSQRAAATLTTIVAADEIGRFPDQNAAESLQRIPGVSLYRDQGEGRFVDVRGLNYVYTSVSLNGAKIASPELGDRAIALDVVPSDSLAVLEVAKVPTPDMDAEGLGGRINLRTRSPFDSTERELQVTAQSIYTHLTDKFNAKTNAMFSDVFADGTVGVLADVTWQERDFGSRNYEEDGLYSPRAVGSAAPSFLALNNLGFRDYVINRERFGANAALEFRPAASTKLFLRGTYNKFTDTEDRHQLYLPFTRGTVTAIDANGFSVSGLSRVRRDIRIREKDQDLTALSAGFERQWDNWTLDGLVGHSKGEEKRPGELTVRIRRKDKDTALTYAASGVYDVSVVQTAGVSIADPAAYNEIDRIELAEARGTETDTNFALNARRDLDTAQPSFLKAGLAYRTKEKSADEDVVRYAAPSSFTFSALSEPASDYPYGPRVPRFSHDKVTQAFFQNRGAFTATPQFTDSNVGDFTSKEDVFGAYGMGGVTVGRTNLMAGLRYERTEFDTEGKQVVDDKTASRVSYSRTYDHLLPGLYLRHDFSKRLVGRLSYSESLMRPGFSESAMYRSIANDAGEVTAGNPGLKALSSQNWDASVEWYLPSLGTVSAAVFLKKIDAFAYEIAIPGGDPAFPDYDLITHRNGSDGDIRGLELSYQQQLRMLPAPLDGLGVMANLTLTDSSATYPTRPGEELPFIGQSKTTGNVALTYEKGRVFARLALTFRSKHLREDEPIGSAAEGSLADRYIDDYHQLDLSVAYRFNKNLQAFAEVSNLTDEPFRVYVQGGGQGKRLVQHEEYGWTANFGIRWRL